MNIEKKDAIQRKALRKWEENDKVGTVEIATGIGKTFIGLHALYTMPIDYKVTHLFLAEVRDRENDFIKEVAKYNKIFNRNVFKDYNVEFHCYQSAFRWRDKKFGLVIADEIHDSLSLSYSDFYRLNTYDSIIGLSATINKNTQYRLGNGMIITKGDLLNKIAPIVYKYSLKQAREENTARKLEIHVIYTQLDNSVKYIKAGNNTRRFFQTEIESYRYWDSMFNKAVSINVLDSNDEVIIDLVKKKELKILVAANRRQSIIYESLQKIDATKRLLDKIDGRSIVFTNNLDSLLKVTPYVISSRNNDKVNERIRNDFESGAIDLIGSFKKLKQGTNLSDLDNVVLMSYYGTTLDLIQRSGRLRENGEQGYMYILLCKGTQEEVWFNKMMEDTDKKDIQYYKNINEFLTN